MSDVFELDGIKYPFVYEVDGLPVFATHEIDENLIGADVLSQVKRIKVQPDYVLLRVVDGWVEGKPMVGRPPKFERIRRVTGYLSGTLDRFNDAKKAEVAERVKHSI